MKSIFLSTRGSCRPETPSTDRLLWEKLRGRVVVVRGVILFVSDGMADGAGPR